MLCVEMQLLASLDVLTLVAEPPSTDERRKLILVSKSLQSLSNRMEFGPKEEYMMGVNKFIRACIPQMTELQNKLAVRCTAVTHVPVLWCAYECGALVASVTVLEIMIATAVIDVVS